MDKLTAQLEALLFAAGNPVTAKQLAKLTAAKPTEVETVLGQLAEHYKTGERGLSILVHEGRYQLVTNPAHGTLVDTFIKEEFTGPLSRAALETLAIIAYRGPISKPAIDTIRGVNSAIMLRTLLIRGLIERTKSRTDARTFEYALTFEFVRHLGLTRIEALPRYEELHANQVVARFAESASSGSIEPQGAPRETHE